MPNQIKFSTYIAVKRSVSYYDLKSQLTEDFSDFKIPEEANTQCPYELITYCNDMKCVYKHMKRNVKAILNIGQ